MPKGIPHANLEIISGEKRTGQYVEMQKGMGKFIYRNL
jgi:hypothetical protein